MKKSILTSLLAAFTATFVLIVFSLSQGLNLGINADVLYPYSFALDIIKQNPLTTWSIPANPYFFPDILFSLPIVLFTQNPVYWFCVANLLQPMAFILLITLYWRDKNSSCLLRYAGVVYVTVFTYFIGEFLFKKDWDTVALKAFTLGHHMFSAILVLFVYLGLMPEKLKHSSYPFMLSLLLLFCITAFSDPFTVIYLTAFIFAQLLLTPRLFINNKRWILLMGVFVGVGLIAIFMNNLFNPTLLVQIHDAKQSTSWIDHIHKFYKVIKLKGIFLFLAIPIILFFSSRQKITRSILLGLFILTIVIAFSGLVFEQYHLRYLGIYFPVLVFAIVGLLPNQYFKTITSPIMSILMVIIASLFISHLNNFTQKLYPREFQPILNCEAFIKQSNNAIVIATYWPAKILFEASQRNFQLIQTQPDLQSTYSWIYNSYWARNNLTNESSKKILIITYQILPNKIKEIKNLPFTQSLCQGQVLSTKPNATIKNILEMTHGS